MSHLPQMGADGRRWVGIWALAALALIALVLAGCANSAYAPEETVQPSNDLSDAGITVFAASSLTEAFEEIGAKFEEETGGGVTFSFSGSSDLRAQLEQGAPADVFASADTNQMGLAKDAGVVDGDGTIFARNRLVVIIPKENRAGVESLADLGGEDVKISLADENVPVGKYARAFLDNATADAAFGPGYKDAVLANVVTNASNVKEVASAVQLDEVDAGIVYKTDVTAAIADDVTAIEIPDQLNPIAAYPIALTTNGQAQSKDAAQAFIDFVLSDAGQAILASHGFMEAQ
jgi:molybdate transport system substrate-binding protein